ncbi:hypothetical protein [Bacillus sp. FJAT-52991]|uniref:CGNR zinc finger domain-containing protein n=1 Tax=Bacillus kandeliae TaxID=3129297 RepID=A0ABZ2NBT5_9BACI
MHELFSFPIRCERKNYVLKDVFYEGRYLINKNHKDTKIEIYDVFDKPDFIPSIVELVKRYRAGENPFKLVEKWVTEWGFWKSWGNFETETKGDYIYSKLDIFDLLITCESFCRDWELCKAIINQDLDQLQRFIRIEEAEVNDENKCKSSHKISVFQDEVNQEITYDILHFPDDILKEYSIIGSRYLADRIDMFLDKVNFALDKGVITWGKETNKIQLSPVLRTEGLFETLYLQLFMIFSENEKKICPVCNDIFSPTRRDKIYCSSSCKLTAKSQRYRARKANLI